jgi:glutaminase
MKDLNSIQPEQLNQWVSQAKQKAQFGKLPSYIPLLEQADPNEFAFSLFMGDHYNLSVGNISKTFPLMSVIKVFSLLDLLTQFGEEFVFQRVGCEASEYSYNSLTQLQLDQGFPRNPMINSGAITLASLLPGKNAIDCCNNFRLWLNQCSGSNLFLDQAMLNSVRSLPNAKNQALVKELTQKRYLEKPELALDIYQQICCLSGNIIDLAYLGMMLIESSCIQPQQSQIVQKIMRSSGLYEKSKTLTFNKYFPTKSGVGGAILSIVPEQGVIACYSPPLNEKGNSIAGLFLIEKIANFLGLF